MYISGTGMKPSKKKVDFLYQIGFHSEFLFKNYERLIKSQVRKKLMLTASPVSNHLIILKNLRTLNRHPKSNVGFTWVNPALEFQGLVLDLAC